jgi:hypothetical protein
MDPRNSNPFANDDDRKCKSEYAANRKLAESNKKRHDDFVTWTTDMTTGFDRTPWSK